jgi:catechol 2,3-dioxygenase-like lactoylglutathione lyase family enzyme
LLTCIQFGLNTTDMAGTLRFYSDAFGFRNAGGQGIWGETIKIQGLSPDSRAIMWWMIGEQPFFQFEIFQHTKPEQRLRPEGWRACDHGWVRIGIASADYDKSLAVIADYGMSLSGEGKGPDGARRCAFYDSFIGAYIEVREAKGASGPSVIYGAASVSDLDAARRFYGETIGLPLGDIAELHSPEDEALWGLPGAKREGFLVKSGDVVLEIVQYADPVGKPRRADHRASDQCFFNAAFGARERGPIAATLDRLRAAGVQQMQVLETPDLLASYVNQPERETEFSVIPVELNGILGFESPSDFFG